MKNQFFSLLALGLVGQVYAQNSPMSTDPAVTSWLQNNTTYGSYYSSGSSDLTQITTLANVQSVEYSSDWVYFHTGGIPAYPTGPFLDGNPSQAEDQDLIARIPLNPSASSNPSNTDLGTIGYFINGVALFNFSDGASYNSSSGQEAGGPLGGQGDGVWNRDAIIAEREGFDCSKGHPAMGNYHHHQNPSAFDLDLNVVSSICNLYDADALYAIDSTAHSPLIGYARDGYPIYGAYAYKNTDGTGGIVRMRSSYSLRNITVRTHYADGTDVTDGPDVSTTYPLGQYQEDYEYVANSDPEYLDEHNGRFSVTPEYPSGTYAYFATVDENWNSAYPYAIGPQYYGDPTGGLVMNISESTTTYTPATTSINPQEFEMLDFNIFPNPSSDFIAIQAKGLLKESVDLKLYDLTGRLIRESRLNQGSTIWYLDVETLYNGQYILHIINGQQTKTKKVTVLK
ncbi:MAG: YHYH protein [Saprospiraceae bacterium]|nr:YHYH protein [Saprospiraceae bacterium]